MNQPADTNNHLSGLTYDAAGNVINDGLGGVFVFDGENRIKTAGPPFSLIFPYTPFLESRKNRQPLRKEYGTYDMVYSNSPYLIVKEKGFPGNSRAYSSYCIKKQAKSCV
jgi:hypothetical protein